MLVSGSRAASLCVVALAWVALASCASGASDSPSPRARDRPTARGSRAPGSGRRGTFIEVTDQPRQTIEGWGMTVTGVLAHEPLLNTGGLTPAQLATLDGLVFRDAGFSLVRVFGPGPDNGPGPVVPWTASDPRLRFMARARARGVRFMFTGAGAPAADRHGGSPTGALITGQGDAYASFLADNLQAAQQAGVPFTWAAIGNEPDNGGFYWLSMTPEQAAHVYNRLAQLLPARGLSVQLALGDNLGWASTDTYADMEEMSPLVRARAAVVASHAYSGTDPASRAALAAFGASHHVSLWMTEWTPGCPRGNCPIHDTMGFALRWADEINHDLAAGAQAWFVFQAVASASHGADGALIVRDPTNPARPFRVTKRFYVFRQYTSAAPRGAQRLVVLSSNPGLGALAFANGRTRALVITNPAAGARRVKLSFGTRSGKLSVRQTSATESFRALPHLRYKGRPVSAQLPAHSVTTFYLRSA